MYPTASGTQNTILLLCIVFTATIPSIVAAPASSQETNTQSPDSLASHFESRDAYGSNKCGGIGIYITNKGLTSETYHVFEGNTTINSIPQADIALSPGASGSIPLPNNFIGHIQRGDLLPAKWVELNMVPGGSDGDVSLEIGCDGPGTVQASVSKEFPNPPIFGFSEDINANAPVAAYFNPENTQHQLGEKLTTAHGVLDAPGDSVNHIINSVTLEYLQTRLSQSQAYLIGGVGTNQAKASDNCLLIIFY